MKFLHSCVCVQDLSMDVVAFERLIDGFREHPRLHGGLGGMPLTPLRPLADRDVDMNELLTFTQLSPNDVIITRQVKGLHSCDEPVV